ncbi:MAG: 6-pyruvoyl-tetrahydropterin synthase-related protein [Patescibacteria group bacterium]|nr:6-pyruvoyl-tetrahydropterin synthase-related protein [Patescibacteria group bacterium]
MFKHKINKKNIFILIILIVLSFPSVYSLLHSGFFQSDDGEWMVIRFSAFYQAFRDGQFPVRFLGRLNNGYGYPVANFLYPGFMYLGIPVHVLGFGFVNVIKIILGLSMAGSAVFSYFWLSKIFNRYSAFIGSLFYLYAPYHLFDLYKRGSVGEILALAIVPFIFWQIERRSLFWTSVGIGLLILSHNTLALLFLPVIIIYAVLSKKFSIFPLRSEVSNFQFSILTGLGLSAFFWIPAFFELSLTRFNETKISDISQYFSDINLIGFSSVFIIISPFIMLVYKFRAIKKDKVVFNRLIIFILLGVFSVFLSLKMSEPFWRFMPSSLIQFPFRLLSYLILSTGFLSAYIIYRLKGNIKYLISAVFVLILAFSSFSYLKPSEFFDKQEGFYATNEGTTTVQDEYLPKWESQKPTEHFKEKIEIVSGKGSIENLTYNSKKISFSFNSQNNSNIRINTIYYPGWKAFIDGNSTNVKYNNPRGIMELSVPEGNHHIKLLFSETPLRLTVDILSILSLFLLILVSKRKRREYS